MEPSQEPKLTKRQRYWLDHIRVGEASGKSLVSYARENDLNFQTMYTTKSTLMKKGVLSKTPRPVFQRAQLISPQPKSDWCIQLPNGVSVMFSDASDTKYLANVLNVVTGIK